MPGQFGENGGPGGVWKVDGATGAVSVFATIPGNRGPALGDIAYDGSTGFFFASDFDAGMIHRIDANGRVLDHFDHGATGRPNAGLPAVADDQSAMNITYPSFDSENTATWGLTQPERRVWGLAVHGGRLYYTVWSGPQVWSVGVSRSGFANDARLEFQVAGGEGSPIAHMTFDKAGTLYLSQRGGVESSYDYTAFAKAGTSKAIRYRQTGGKWTREDYAIGFSPRQQNASGGAALGYGYDAKGKLDQSRCDATLWTTGDSLRNDPAKAAELAPGGPPIVHGLQGNDVSWVKPADAPARSFFIDYDGVQGDARAEGHVGSAAIFQQCSGKSDASSEQHASEELAPSGRLDCPGCNEPEKTECQPGDPKCGETPCDPRDPYCSKTPCTPGDPYCHRRNLKISKQPVSSCHKAGGGFVCAYRITVTNTGPDDYDGLIRVRDVVQNGAQLIASGFPEAPCNLVNTVCATPAPVHLIANNSISFVVRVKTSALQAKRLRCHVHNLARIVYAPGGSNANTNPADDEASAIAIIPSNECEKEKANLKIEKRAEQCVHTGANFTCVYDLKFINTGPGDYRSPIVFTDTIPNGTTASVISPTFTCVGGPVYVCTSNGPVTLSPGGSVNTLVKVVTPATMIKALRCRVPNVAHISQAVGGSEQNTDPGDDTAIAYATIPAPNCAQERTNLKIEKRAEPCAKSGAGYNCLYDVRYTNTGPGTYQGVIAFTDTLPSGATATFLSPDFTCVGGPAYTCTSNGAVTLAAGASGGVLINVVVPLDVAKAQDCQIASTVQIVLAPPGSDQNTDNADDSASATALAPPPGCTPQSPPDRKTCTPGLEFNPETARCESPLGPACPADTQWNAAARSCEPFHRGASCPEGQKWDVDHCAAEKSANQQCPEGSTGLWPRCKTAGQNCPPGWKWDSDRCILIDSIQSDSSKPDSAKCPTGFEKVGGRCVKQQPTGVTAPETCVQADGSRCAAEADANVKAPANEAAAPAADAPQHVRAQSMRERTTRSRGAMTSAHVHQRAIQQRQRQRAQMQSARRKKSHKPKPTNIFGFPVN
jgi:hypothetical protein